jgi:hypothetical protein
MTRPFSKRRQCSLLGESPKDHFSMDCDNAERIRDRHPLDLAVVSLTFGIGKIQNGSGM